MQLESIPDNESLNDTQSRKSTRITRPPDFGQGIVPNSQRFQANAVKFEPNTFNQAMNSDDNEMWGEAINEEMRALNKNDTWVIVPRPTNQNIVGSKWVFKIKTYRY